MTGNLPNWPGAAVCYSRAYALLDRMARSGGVSRRRSKRRWSCSVSSDMDYIIGALNRGDEEAIKAALYSYRSV